MARAQRLNVYRGYEGACIQSASTGLSYGQIINVSSAEITFRFRQPKDYRAAIIASVDAYLATCRRCRQKPERPAGLTPLARVPGRAARYR